MATIALTAPDGLVPAPLRETIAGLDGVDKRRLYSVAGEYMMNLVRKYILRIVPRNHKTALSFTPAATPTGHLEKAARNTVYAANGSAALVQVTSPGITRAFHPLEIRAKGKMLTIPARTAPEAYGKRAREVAVTERLFLVKSRNGGAFLATGDESKAAPCGRGRRPPLPRPERPNRPHRAPPLAMNTGVSGVRPVFWLRAAVTIPQKRDILPSDEQIAVGGAEGILRGVKSVARLHGVTLK